MKDKEFDEDYEELIDAFDIKIYKNKDYNRITFNKRYMPEHRFKVELFLNRDLDRKEVIHHKNLDKKDNRIENLYITNNSKHMKLHFNLIELLTPLIKIFIDKGWIFFDDLEEKYKIMDKSNFFDYLKKDFKAFRKYSL